jgi:hypothetical protein
VCRETWEWLVRPDHDTVQILLNKETRVRFRGLFISLLLLNTLLLAGAIFICVIGTAGLPWYGLIEFLPVIGAPVWTYLIGSLMFFESMLLFALFGVKAAYALGAVFCIVVSTAATVPGRVDELSHLAFIQHVSQHARIPLIREKVPWEFDAMFLRTYPNQAPKTASKMKSLHSGIYKTTRVAFQPPLYYLVMAVWYPLLPANLVQKTRGLRLLGGVLLLVAVFFVQRTLALLSETANKHGNAYMSNLLQFGVICLICLSPGIVYRMTILGNVQAGFVLAAMTAYWLCRMMTRGTERLPEVAVLGILGGLLALSYYYSIVLLGVIALWMLLTRRFKGLFVFGGMVFLLTSPWLVHNYLTYGTINAAEAAKQYNFELGMGIGRYGMAAAWGILTLNLSRLFLPQESYIFASSMLQGVERLAHYVAWGSLLAVVVCAATAVVRRMGLSARQAGQLDFLLIAAAVVAGTMA